MCVKIISVSFRYIIAYLALSGKNSGCVTGRGLAGSFGKGKGKVGRVILNTKYFLET